MDTVTISVQYTLKLYKISNVFAKIYDDCEAVKNDNTSLLSALYVKARRGTAFCSKHVFHSLLLVNIILLIEFVHT